jgi:V/A-type H+-transporting ATPase subunit F
MNSLKFFIIADEHTINAFSLAGVRGEVAHTPDQVQELLAQSWEDPEVGLVLITERLADQVREVVDGARRDRLRPLILEIPDLAGPVARQESLLDRLRSLMGLPR